MSSAGRAIFTVYANTLRLEKDWHTQVVKLARSHGWKVTHFHDSRRTRRDGTQFGDADAAGWPDLTLTHPTETGLVFAELKTDTGKVTASQHAQLERLAAAGQETHIWRPRDAAAVYDRLTSPGAHQ